MLRGTRENISFLASISNCAGVMALCFVLLATTVVVSPQTLHSTLLQPAYAQQVEEEGEEGTTDTGTEEEREEGTTDTGTEEEGEEGTTDTGTEEEGEEGTTTTESLTAEISSNYTAEEDHVAPATFSFNATIAGGTEPYTVNWNFGDDSEESDEQSVVHTFNEAGNYTVTLTITDSEGETATDTLELTVEESSEEPPTDEEPSTTESLTAESLTAEIISNYTAEEDHVAPATFSFNATIAGGTEPYTVNWNFGDDSEESDEQSVVHTFNEAGNYTVTLTITDSEGETATDTLELTVEESPTDEEPVPLSEGGTDEWGIKELYPTASNGPTWYIREVEDPTTDSLFYYGIYEGTTIKSIGTGVWQVDARSGTQEHGI